MRSDGTGRPVRGGRRRVRRRARRRRRAGDAPIIVGGLGNGEANNCGTGAPGGGILFVDGIIYARRRSTSTRSTRATARCSGTTTGRRAAARRCRRAALGMWRNYIYFTMHDNWVVCLDAKTGKEVWRHEIAPHDQQYLSSNAPMVDRRPCARRHGQRPRRAGVPEVARSAHRRRAVDPVLDAAEPRRSGPRDVGEPRRRAPRQRRDVDSRAPTIRRRSSTSTAPAIRRRPTRRAAAKATTCSRRRCSRSTSTPARWRGTSRPRRTTRTTGTRRRRRSSSTCRSTDACASW